MRLTTLPGPTPDGRLAVVSSDLTQAVDATDLSPTLLQALERWEEVEAPLQERAAALAAGSAEGAVAFDQRQALAPLPRAPQWLDGSVFENHLGLMAAALHPDAPHEPYGFPLMYQGQSDRLLSSRSDIAGFEFDEGIDFEGEFGIIVDAVPMRIDAEAALDHIKLVVLLNDISLRRYAPAEVRTGFGFLNAKPPTAFAPVALTPDELGSAWDGGRVHLGLQVERSGAWFGHPNGAEMTYHFGELVAHAAKTRDLAAGTIIGSGTVSNADRSVGSACIAERRAIEVLDNGAPTTAFLGHGERVRMQVLDHDGHCLFGQIEQSVVIDESGG
jgi:fumarylacetoacetate (FAA) hydrolase